MLSHHSPKLLLLLYKGKSSWLKFTVAVKSAAGALREILESDAGQGEKQQTQSVVDVANMLSGNA